MSKYNIVMLYLETVCVCEFFTFHWPDIDHCIIATSRCYYIVLFFRRMDRAYIWFINVPGEFANLSEIYPTLSLEFIVYDCFIESEGCIVIIFSNAYSTRSIIIQANEIFLWSRMCGIFFPAFKIKQHHLIFSGC